MDDKEIKRIRKHNEKWVSRDIEEKPKTKHPWTNDKIRIMKFKSSEISKSPRTR